MHELLIASIPVAITGLLTLLGIIFKDYLPGRREAIRKEKEAVSTKEREEQAYKKEVRDYLVKFNGIFDEHTRQLNEITATIDVLQ